MRGQLACSGGGLYFLRTHQKEINEELEKSKDLVTTVDESLELATDADPTVPMDLSSGMTASVESMILRGEVAPCADAENPKDMAPGQEARFSMVCKYIDL